MKQKKHIAYLVPEYPVVSETFVYREIRVLIARGYQISTYSLRDTSIRTDVNLDGLPKVEYIYSAPFASHFFAFLVCLFTSLNATLRTLGLFLHDTFKLPGWKSKGKLLVQLFAGAFLAKKLKGSQVDHLHVHFIHSPAQVAMYASSFSGVPFTITAHATDIYTHGQLLVEKSQRAKSIVTISEFNKNYLESIGIQSSKISVIRCILDLPDSEKIRHPEGIQATFVFGSLGRLVPKKGFLTLLRAFKLILNANEALSLQLQIAGSGPQRIEIENLIKALDLENNVKLLGALHQSAVPTWMGSLDCFVLACEQDAENGDVDGIPVVLMESMSFGIPSISTKVSGVPELVIDGVTGLLADPGNPESLSQAMFKMISGDKSREELIVQAQKHVFDEFSKTNNANRLIEIFEASQ